LVRLRVRVRDLVNNAEEENSILIIEVVDSCWLETFLAGHVALRSTGWNYE
jgi:hypothetical protein